MFIFHKWSHLLQYKVIEVLFAVNSGARVPKEYEFGVVSLNDAMITTLP